MSDDDECRRCGCNELRVIRQTRSQGRRFSKQAALWVLLNMTTTRYACGHCGHEWTQTVQETMQEEAKQK